MTHFILVNESHGNTAAGFDPHFVLAHAEYHAWCVIRVFPTGMDREFMIDAYGIASARQRVPILVHHDTSHVYDHVMTMMGAMVIFALRHHDYR
jgi:hypothetical protein